MKKEMIKTFDTIYGGYNDRAVLLVQEFQEDNYFFLRAREEDGRIDIFLRCDDVFEWATSDLEILPEEYWEQFDKEHFNALCNGIRHDVLNWYAAAWAVKLRGVAPQIRNPEFIKMLDYLEVPWREMESYEKSRY